VDLLILEKIGRYFTENLRWLKDAFQ